MQSLETQDDPKMADKRTTAWLPPYMALNESWDWQASKTQRKELFEAIFKHSEFISYTDKEISSLTAVDGNLSDQLIKALGVQFFSYGTNATIAGLQTY